MQQKPNWPTPIIAEFLIRSSRHLGLAPSVRRSPGHSWRTLLVASSLGALVGSPAFATDNPDVDAKASMRCALELSNQALAGEDADRPLTSQYR